jgi:hypothetical protein
MREGTLWLTRASQQGDDIATQILKDYNDSVDGTQKPEAEPALNEDLDAKSR